MHAVILCRILRQMQTMLDEVSIVNFLIRPGHRRSMEDAKMCLNKPDVKVFI